MKSNLNNYRRCFYCISQYSRKANFDLFNTESAAENHRKISLLSVVDPLL